MNQIQEEKNIEQNQEKPPNSSKSKNTYKDFLKICRAYYDELMHICKHQTPSLSKKDIIILSDLIDEVATYSNELLSSKFIKQAKEVLNIGLVISDHLLKIFGDMVEEYNKKNSNDENNNNNNNNSNNNCNKININTNLSEKLRYPLSLKLKLLKLNFKILIQNEKNYIDSEKNLKEIINLQTYLKSSNYNLATSKFWLAKICYYLEKFDDAAKLALEAKNLFENSQKKNSDEKLNIDNDTLEKNIEQNVSNIFRFLAQVYLIKNDYKTAATYYEHGYYLNLGRWGAENPDTKYFKEKLDSINEELDKYPSVPGLKTKSNTNNNDINTNTNFNYQNQNNNNNNFEKILHKGQAGTFSFKIPSSSLLEPFLVTLYKIDHKGVYDKYSAELLFGNVIFDKQKLIKFLKLKGNNNNINQMFYTDENLNTILGNLMINNGYLVFMDKNLKNCLINSSCPMKRI